MNYPPIEVAEIKGQKIAINGNSRLTIAKKAKLSLIRINITTDSERLNELQKRLKKNGLGSQGTSELPTCKG